MAGSWDKNVSETIDVSAATGSAVTLDFSLNSDNKLEELIGENESGETFLEIKYFYDPTTHKNNKVEVYYMGTKKEYTYT